MTSVRCPNFQVVGWIPFFKNFRSTHMRSYWIYAQKSKRRSLACELLFLSGNRSFPLPLLSEQQFDDLIKTKDYRGALSLRDILVNFHKNQNGIGSCTSLNIGDSVGYTPIRGKSLNKTLLFGFAKGEIIKQDGFEYRPLFNYTTSSKDEVQLSHEVCFRIGRIGRFFARFLTGHQPPFVKFRVDYIIKDDNSVSIFFTGTKIPNHECIVIGQTDWTYSMLTNTLNEINDFFEPKNKNAIALTYLPIKLV